MYKQILIALDGSEESEQVLPWAKDLALPDGAAAILLHVCPEPELVVAEGGQVISYLDQEEARLRQKGITYLDCVARGLDEAGVPVKTMVCFGDPVERILETATETGADLIALATHARRGLGRLIHGSVATAVLRRAEVPVLLLREERQGVTV